MLGSDHVLVTFICIYVCMDIYSHFSSMSNGLLLHRYVYKTCESGTMVFIIIHFIKNLALYVLISYCFYSHREKQQIAVFTSLFTVSLTL